MFETNVKSRTYQKSRQMLLGIQRQIKNLITVDVEKADFNKPGHVEPGVAFIDGKAVKRLIVILKGCGCEWAQQEDGGCVMCGHLSGSSKGQFISEHKLQNQFDSAMGDYDFKEYPMLCLYNGGSFLNEEEISAPLRRYMLRRIGAIPHIKRLIIESRTNYITESILDEIQELLPGITVEIGVGLETASDLIRNLVLNKGVASRDLIEAGEKFRNRKIKMLAYILVNPPFLTEIEAISDAVSSIEFARRVGASIVSLEAVSIQHLTLVSFLSEAGFYKPPWIWSMFEIIKRTAHLGLDIRIGGFEFFPIPKEFTSNCPACNEQMINRINRFNEFNDLEIIKNAECPDRCDLKWKADLQKVDTRDLPTRIVSTLKAIDVPQILNRLQGYSPTGDRGQGFKA